MSILWHRHVAEAESPNLHSGCWSGESSSSPPRCNVGSIGNSTTTPRRMVEPQAGNAIRYSMRWYCRRPSGNRSVLLCRRSEMRASSPAYYDYCEPRLGRFSFTPSCSQCRMRGSVLLHTHVSDLRLPSGCIGAFEPVLGEVSVGVHAISVSMLRHWLVRPSYYPRPLPCRSRT